MENTSDTPIIDWNQALQLAGQNQELAKDIANMLITGLPNDLEKINQAYEAQNYPEIMRLAHKLHGALCYSGMPRLKIVVADLETKLKNNIIDNLPTQIDQLNIEAGLLLECYTRQNI